MADAWKKERPLVNVCDGTIAFDEMVRNLLSARKTGEDAMTELVTQFTTTVADVTDPKRAKYNDPIKKQKIYTFTNQQQKKKKHQTIPEDKCKSSGNVLTQFDEKRLDMKRYCNGQLQVSHGPFVPKLTKEDQAVNPCLETIYSSYLLHHAWQQ